jgi:hypothetical protein
VLSEPNLGLTHALSGRCREGSRRADRAPRARVTLRDPGSGSELVLWMDESHSHLMVFTGDPVPSVNRRSIAIEPMTCPPNAFRSGTQLVVLEPGETFRAAGGSTPRRNGPPRAVPGSTSLLPAAASVLILDGSGSWRPLFLAEHEDAVDDPHTQGEDAERPPRVGAAD